MTRTYQAASVRALAAVVDRVAPDRPDRPVGVEPPSRRKQLLAVVGMWDRALTQWPQERRRPTGAVEGMFTEPALRAFWELAVAGRLRARAEDVGRALPLATQRVVRDCLAILADQVMPGREVWLPEIAQQAPKPTVPAGQLGVLYRRLVDMASDAPVERGGIALSYEDRVRLLALVAVVLDTGARSGELEAMRRVDLGEGEGSVVVRRAAQNASVLPRPVIAQAAGVSVRVVDRVMTGAPRVSEAAEARVLAAVDRLGGGTTVEERLPLRDGTRVALRRWLRVRAGLVAGLEGGDPGALWLGLQANQYMPLPGLPLRAGGIRHAYRRGVEALNFVMAGRHGWEPLPVTMEQLRRAVAAELEQQPVPVG